MASQFIAQEASVSINMVKVKDLSDIDGYFRFFFRFHACFLNASIEISKTAIIGFPFVKHLINNFTQNTYPEFCWQSKNKIA